MKTHVSGIPAELLAEHASPCISIFMPTSRKYPEKAQDALKFRNLATRVEDEGVAIVGKRQMEPLVELLDKLHNDESFWAHSLEGIAVFVSPDYFRVLHLLHPVTEQVHVSDVFYVKPLIRTFQKADRFQVLAITRTDVKLYEGNRYLIYEIAPASDVPKNMSEDPGEGMGSPHQSVAGVGNLGSDSILRHGYSSRKEEEQIDDERYFRRIDHAILEHHSKPSTLPLILAALPIHQSLFRSVCHNPFLVAEGIDEDPHALETEALRDKAWSIVEPRWQQGIDELIARYEGSRSKNQGSDDPFAVAAAAVASNVSVLLLDSERVYPGSIDPVNGDIEFTRESPLHVHDVLEDLAVITLRTGGEVLVLPADRMSSESGVAAIFRHG